MLIESESKRINIVKDPCILHFARSAPSSPQLNTRAIQNTLGRQRSYTPAHYLVNLRFQGFTRTVCSDISGLASHGLSTGVEFRQGKYTSGLKLLKLTSTALLHTLCAIQAQSVQILLYTGFCGSTSSCQSTALVT